jgi:hypothetical protein
MEPSPDKPEVVGSPSVLAEAEEMPKWFSDIVTAISAGPIIIGFIVGSLGFVGTAICYILTLFI